MKTNRPLPKDWREGRRLRAWELHRQGWKHPRDAQRDGYSAKEAPDHLFCCCAFCKDVAFLSCCQQASAVTRRASEAVLHNTTYLLQPRCASRGKQKDIAVALGVTEGAVSQWIAKGKAQGPEALRHHPSPGAPPKLRPESWRSCLICWHGELKRSDSEGRSGPQRAWPK